MVATKGLLLVNVMGEVDVLVLVIVGVKSTLLNAFDPGAVKLITGDATTAAAVTFKVVVTADDTVAVPPLPKG